MTESHRVSTPWGVAHLRSATFMSKLGFGTSPRVYPVTVVMARYSGGYEGGVWLSFPCDPSDLDSEDARGWQGSDVDCAQFWDRVRKENWPIGRGKSPDEAHEDMIKRLAEQAGVSVEDLTESPTWDGAEITERLPGE